MATTLVLWGVGMKRAIPLESLAGLLNLLPWSGLSLRLPFLSQRPSFQFHTVPYIVITLTILFLHVVSANLLIPKFIANRVKHGCGGGDGWDLLGAGCGV